MIKGSRADQFSGIHEKYFVCILDGIQTMGNDYARGFFRQFIKYLLENLFCDGVNICGGFIQDQQLRITQKSVHEWISCFVRAKYFLIG